jgi:hypothetical protein
MINLTALCFGCYIILCGFRACTAVRAAGPASDEPLSAVGPTAEGYAHCTQKAYESLSYHPNNNDIKQPLLLGMPNSGVVWMRDILEQISRKYGGTIGHANGSSNLNYEALFPYGIACNKQSDVLACEHPALVRANIKGTISFTTKLLERYCRFGGIYTLRTLIFMIR